MTLLEGLTTFQTEDKNPCVACTCFSVIYLMYEIILVLQIFQGDVYNFLDVKIISSITA